MSNKSYQRNGHIIDQITIQDTIHRFNYKHELQAHETDPIEQEWYNT